MRKSRLRSRSLAVAVIASLLLALGPAAARAEDSVDDGTVAASDNETPNGWFVELTTPPTSDGTSSVAVAASQDEFRAAAKGKGVSCAEGIDYQNPDLGGCFGPSCRVFTGWDFVGDDYDAGGKGPALVPHPGPDPKDCQGHGTHVSGIVGARGLVTGVAPDVRFGAYRVFG